MRSASRAQFSIDRQLPRVRATGTPNAAVSAQTRRSQATARAQPPPTATPSIEAMVGTRTPLQPIDDRADAPLVGQAVLAGADGR